MVETSAGLWEVAQELGGLTFGEVRLYDDDDVADFSTKDVFYRKG